MLGACLLLKSIFEVSVSVELISDDALVPAVLFSFASLLRYLHPFMFLLVI
jgi:hypothetical protein